LTRKSDAEVIREVSDRIDLAIRENRRHERVIVVVLVSLFAVGLGLILYGRRSRHGNCLPPGGLLQGGDCAARPAAHKIAGRQCPTPDPPPTPPPGRHAGAKALAAKLIDRLIEQV
jgi:hypothetical protein